MPTLKETTFEVHGNCVQQLLDSSVSAALHAEISAYFVRIARALPNRSGKTPWSLVLRMKSAGAH